MSAGGTRLSKARSLRAAWATAARLRKGLVIPRSWRRAKNSATQALMAVHKTMPTRPLSKKRIRLAP
ncbi:hypothetical protein D3C73_1454050 [compost metagenome]